MGKTLETVNVRDTEPLSSVDEVYYEEALEILKKRLNRELVKTTLLALYHCSVPKE